MSNLTQGKASWPNRIHDALVETAEAFTAWRATTDKLNELQSAEQDRLRMADLWRFQSKEIEQAEEVRLTGGTNPDKQIHLALFLASERSNHISGKLIHVNDDWKKLERENMNPEAFTLRRLSKM